MAKSKILVVDDEKKIVSLVRAYLEHDGYQVVEAYDGKQALAVFQREKPDLIILDIMLPELDGIEVCRQIRRSSEVPIIMLTAKDEDTDKIVGLELGADDYLTKPFSPRELVARIKAIFRRTHPQKPPSSSAEPIIFGGLVLDEERFKATCSGNPLDLTTTEFRILAALIRASGRVLSRAQILDIALGETYEGYERTIDVHIKNLRQKLAAAVSGKGCLIVTVRGIGYKFQEPDNV
ncbi:response regulator transcription factor [Candidatus Pacearchaeota archaeon]|nr:response regulator transcription factor [Candidatus Pacearchaeota archaeon]